MNHRALALLLFPVLLGTGGCVGAAGLVIGPVAGSVMALSDRSVERTMPADLSTTWGASVDALARMALRVEKTDKADGRWQVTGRDGGVTVYTTLEPVTANMTKVSVRVEAGSLFADKRTGEELLNQVGASLSAMNGVDPRGATPAAEVSAAQLDNLHRAIERLGSKVDSAAAAREARRPAAVDAPGPTPMVMTTPIITVPASAGVATIPAPPSQTPIYPSRAVPVVLRDEPEAPATSAPRAPARDPVTDVMAKPLPSAETLRPVEGLTTGPVAR